MAKDYSRVFKLDSGPSELVETPIVRKKFRVTIDVEATLASGTQGIMLPPSPEGVCHTEALTERLLAQPELVDQLLRCRAVEVAKQAGKALEAEYGWGETSEDELLGPVFAELEPDARTYFTEELEDGRSAYYFDGCDATVERASVARMTLFSSTTEAISNRVSLNYPRKLPSAACPM
jgi:hypothetical protein